MNIHFSNITFKQNIKNSQNNNTNKKIQPRLAESNIFKQNERIAEEDIIDPRFAVSKTHSGIVMPSSYEDCFERMSFENDNEIDIWRDSYYEPEHPQTYNFDNRDELTSHFIKERKYSYQNYNYDDVPLSDSLLRKDYGFIGTPHSGIDTDMSDIGVHEVKFINFIEEIVPSTIKPKYFNANKAGSSLSEFASLANMLYEDGYGTNEIIRAMERSIVKESKNSSYAELDLFKFLVKHPNLKNEVVVKNQNAAECFDRNFANYFGILKEHYFDNEKDVRKALNLCRIKKHEFPLVNKDLCEIVGLLRHKTAQGIPFEETQNNSTDYRAKRQSKYCDRKQPLTQKDIKLINQIKSDSENFQIKLDIVKNQLKNEKQTVDYILTNLDNLVEEALEAEKIKLQEAEKTEKKINTESKASTEKNIEKPKNTEVETKANIAPKKDAETKIYVKPEAKVEVKPTTIKTNSTRNLKAPSNQTSPLMKASKELGIPDKNITKIQFNNTDVIINDSKASINRNIFTGIINRLKSEKIKPAEITNVLKNLSKLGNTINIDEKTVEKYLDIVLLKSEDDKTYINDNFSTLVTKIWSSSRKLEETEIKIFEKIKNTPEADINLLVKTVEKMLEQDVPNNKIIENIDEIFKYSQRMDKATTKLLNGYDFRYRLSMSRDTITKILDALNVELKFSLKKDNFSCSKTLILPIVEDLTAGKVDYHDALKKISLAKWKLF